MSKAQLAARLTTLMNIARAAVAGADPDLRDAIAAQSFLLPQTAHPSALAQHGPAFAGRAPARSRLGAVVRLLRGAARREADWAGAVLPPRAGILVLSHYVGAGVTDDCFGSLAAVQMDGLPTITARLNHTWRPLHRVAAHKDGGVVLSRHTPLREGLRNLRALTRAARALGPFVGDAFYVAHIRAQASSSSNLFALRTATQVSRLVQRLQPKVLLLTWEGHPWERLAIAAARSASPGITCIAYHHGPLWPLATATAQPLHPDYDPDALAVTGDAAQSFFSARPLWQTRPVRIVGSPRAAGPGQSPGSYMESAADWPPPITRVPRKPKVAQFCAAPWPNFTPPLTEYARENRVQGPDAKTANGALRRAAHTPRERCSNSPP